jgi:hypothetical protein
MNLADTARRHHLLPHERWFATRLLARQRTHRTPTILRMEYNYGREGITLCAAALAGILPAGVLEVGPSKGYEKSFGSTPAPSDLFTKGPGQSLLAADIAAIDRGEGRTILCSFRGLYGKYPRRFRGYRIDLGPEGPIARPGYLLRPWLQPVAITEELISARVRPFGSRKEAIVHNGAGLYAQGAPLESAGSVVVTCKTSRGVLEFCVRRPDLRLFLHYIELMRRQRHSSPSEGL